MFEQDYVMRMIKEMVRMLIKLLFNVDSESPSVELLEDSEEREMLKRLLDMVDAGHINEAENELYELLTDEAHLKAAFLFYSYLNDQDNAFLEANGFSREEVVSGMKNVVKRLGLDSVAEMFLEGVYL
jgi:hypothetical protein